MSYTRTLSLPALMLTTAVGLCLVQPAAADVSNPFTSISADSGSIQLAQGKCGEGKCGGKMQRKAGKCGMQRMDADGDGNVSRDEFMKGHEEMFDRIDKNGDGVIDSAERDGHRQMMRKRKGRCGMGRCGQGKAE